MGEAEGWHARRRMALQVKLQAVRAVAASNESAAVTSSGGEGDSGGPVGALEMLYEYMCPITAEIMTDPVCTADGFTYERTAITEWLQSNTRSPSTGAKLPHPFLIPNITVRRLLQHL